MSRHGWAVCCRLQEVVSLLTDAGGTERATYEQSLSSRSRRFKAARRWPHKHDGRGGGGVCSQLQRSARSLVGLFCPGTANIPLASAQDRGAGTSQQAASALVPLCAVLPRVSRGYGCQLQNGPN